MKHQTLWIYYNEETRNAHVFQNEPEWMGSKFGQMIGTYERPAEILSQPALLTWVTRQAGLLGLANTNIKISYYSY